MSNLRLSSEIINLSPESQSGELIINNTHQAYSLLFKVLLLPNRSKPKFKKYSKYDPQEDCSNLERK
jgi:hypothetical protein